MGAFLDIRSSLERFCMDFAKENLADGQGTSFPVSGLTANMVFYRSDEDKLYQLESAPSTWTELPYDYFLFDFDAHVEKSSFPLRHLIGIKDFSIATEGKLFIASAGIALSVYNDTALQKHNRVMDKLFEHLFPNNKLSLYNITDNSGDALTDMKIMDGSEVLPMSKSNTRSIQIVGVFLSTSHHTVK